MQPEPLLEEHLEELRRFLAAVFQVPPDAPFLDGRLMHWKYFEPLEQWPDPRSWVIRESGQIVAHCGIWPLWYRQEGELIPAQHLIDWAASRTAAGAGAWIYMFLARRRQLTLTVGGSREARPVLPRMGFLPSGVQQVWGRPLRPWAQALGRRGVPAWEKTALLGRNWLWSHAPLSAAPEWTAVAVDRLEKVVPAAHTAFTAMARPPHGYDFLQRCPSVRTTFYQVLLSGRPCGFLVMARVGRQARLVDWQVEPAGPESWRAALALAVRVASRDSGAHELLTAASVPGLEQALAANGFRPRAQKPIFLHDRDKLLAGQPPLQVHMADADAFFLYSEGEAYVT
jgi:hypothetical protein